MSGPPNHLELLEFGRSGAGRPLVLPGRRADPTASRLRAAISSSRIRNVITPRGYVQGYAPLELACELRGNKEGLAAGLWHGVKARSLKAELGGRAGRRQT
jgi:hypothetical protein